MFGEWLWIPLLIAAVGSSVNTAHQTNMAKKEARTQQLAQEKALEQQAKEAEEMVAAARAPKAPKQQTMKSQAVPEYSAQSSMEDLSIRKRRGKSALRVPKTGAGIRIPS